MKIKRYFYAIVSIIGGLATCYFIITSEVMYAVLACAVALLFTMLFFTSLFQSSNPYDKKLKKILRTYDSILVEIECIPKISNKKVVKTKYFKDLVNVQFEVRKPIYYLNKALFCDFAVITNDTVYVYTLKREKNYQSEIEKLLEEKDSTKIDKNINEKLAKENESIKKEIEEIKKENDKVKSENEAIKNTINEYDMNQNYNNEYYYQDENNYQYNDNYNSQVDNIYQNDDINNYQSAENYNNELQNNVESNRDDFIDYDDLDKRIEELKKELNKDVDI